MSNVTLSLTGASVTVTLPDEAIARLRLEPGQEMALTELPDGFRLTKIDPESERRLRLVDVILDRHSETLRLLADR